jgi:hypothetical protein
LEEAMLKRHWMGSLLAAQVLGFAQGLPAAPAPALPAGDPADAVAAIRWRQQRILDVDDDGYAQRASGRLSLRQQANVYGDHGAQEAQDLLHQSQAKRGLGVLALFYSPALGALAGYELAQIQPGQGQVIRGHSSADVFTAAGAALGLGSGIAVLWDHRAAARELRAQAAESYNRQLLQDLRLWVSPQRGGAQVQMNANF